MEIPIKIPSDSAKIITNLVLNFESLKKSNHLINDRKSRLETVAKKPLLNLEDIRGFLISFLTNSTAYFSNTRINRNFVPVNIDDSLLKIIASELSKLKDKANELEKNVPYKIPLYMVSNDTKPCIVNTNIYMYCVKDNAVLVLVMKMYGDIIPRLFDDYHLRFNFSPITFLDFEIEAENIPNIIIVTEKLNLLNQYVSILFSLFTNQASIAIEQMEWEEADQRALNSLNPKERELLDLYLPIFDRYGDLDPDINEIIDEIQELWNKLEINLDEWVIFSPSYCLPTWFEDFFNHLIQDDKEYLYKINPNKITPENNSKVLIFLIDYKSQLEQNSYNIS